MQAWTGGVLVAAMLLVVAGVPKIARPTPTAAALRSVGLTFVTRTHVRLLALVEVTVGIVAILRGGVVIDAVVAVIYVCFSAFLVGALRSSSSGVSCGCAGRDDTPPTVAHLVLATTLALMAAAAALTGGHTGLTDLTRPWTATDALVVVLALIGTWLGWVVLTLLPDLRLQRNARTAR